MKRFFIFYYRDEGGKLYVHDIEVYNAKTGDEAIEHGLKKAQKMYVISCYKHYIQVYPGNDLYIDGVTI